jgi:hypothetical protein
VNDPCGVRSPATDTCPTDAGFRPANETVLTPILRPYDVRTTDPAVEERPRRVSENPPDGGDRRRPAARIGRHDQGRQRCQCGGRKFEDSVSQCAILSRMGSPNTPPATGREKTEVSRLPGHFRIG